MKNIQVIDGADNAAYLIYATSDEDFSLIFPAAGQDVEFVNDFLSRTESRLATRVLTSLWQHPVERATVRGIHGTLFYELDWKKSYYPTKRWADFDDPDASSRRASSKRRR